MNEIMKRTDEEKKGAKKEAHSHKFICYIHTVMKKKCRENHVFLHINIALP